MRNTLEQLDQAVQDHLAWHANLLRVIVCELPGDPNDVVARAHHLCRFGRWYYERTPPELREQPTFVAIGIEHRQVHDLAARILSDSAAGRPVQRPVFDELIATSVRLRGELELFKRELRAALRSRDTLTGALDRDQVLPELRRWRATSGTGTDPWSILLMDIDDLEAVNGRYGYPVGDALLAESARLLQELLRPGDKILWYMVAVVAAGAALYAVNRHRSRQFALMVSQMLARELAPDKSRTKRFVKQSIVLLALASLVIALANPQMGTRVEEIKREGIDLFVALDVSLSMKAEDIKPNRLDKAKRDISNLLNKLAGDRVGLIVFAGDAYVQFPLTADYSAADLFINAVDAGPAGVRLECQYNRDLFDQATVARWLASVETLLAGAVADPSLTVGRLPVLSDEERRLLRSWNATATQSVGSSSQSCR